MLRITKVAIGSLLVLATIGGLITAKVGFCKHWHHLHHGRHHRDDAHRVSYFAERGHLGHRHHYHGSWQHENEEKIGDWKQAARLQEGLMKRLAFYKAQGDEQGMNRVLAVAHEQLVSQGVPDETAKAMLAKWNVDDDGKKDYKKDDKKDYKKDDKKFSETLEKMADWKQVARLQEGLMKRLAFYKAQGDEQGMNQMLAVAREQLVSQGVPDETAKAVLAKWKVFADREGGYAWQDTADRDDGDDDFVVDVDEDEEDPLGTAWDSWRSKVHEALDTVGERSREVLSILPTTVQKQGIEAYTQVSQAFKAMSLKNMTAMYQ